jgi:LPLT family lysophospholipid transporter-like MFS transporter
LASWCFFLAAACVLPAYALLILIGILGGFFVVPLNALLQEQADRRGG